MPSSRPGLITTVRDEVARLDTSRLALRKFGVVVGGVFLGIAAFLVWRNGWVLTTVGTVLAAIGTPLVLLGLVAPGLLRRVHRVWMTFALVLGFVMTKVILTAVFILVFTPIALVLRLLGKRLIDPGPDAAMATYWKSRPPSDPPRERLERSF
jgi:hypothetical protein